MPSTARTVPMVTHGYLHKNDSDARYCEKCGMPTTFFEEGLLKDWQDAKNLIESNEAEDEAAAAEDNFEIPF